MLAIIHRNIHPRILHGGSRSVSLSLSLSLSLPFDLAERVRAHRFFVLGRRARISLGFSTFILARIAGPTFHREFSRYRARKVAKTCSRISFPLLSPSPLPLPPPARCSLENRRPARGRTVRHARRIKLSSRKLAYYLPDRDNSPRSHERCLPSLFAMTPVSSAPRENEAVMDLSRSRLLFRNG